MSHVVWLFMFGHITKSLIYFFRSRFLMLNHGRVSSTPPVQPDLPAAHLNESRENKKTKRIFVFKENAFYLKSREKNINHLWGHRAMDSRWVLFNCVLLLSLFFYLSSFITLACKAWPFQYLITVIPLWIVTVSFPCLGRVCVATFCQSMALYLSLSLQPIDIGISLIK